jgi:hypothetical protein
MSQVTKDSYVLRNGAPASTRSLSAKPHRDPTLQPGQWVTSSYQGPNKASVVHSVTWCPDTYRWVVSVPGFSGPECEFRAIDGVGDRDVVLCTQQTHGSGCRFCSQERT